MKKIFLPPWPSRLPYQTILLLCLATPFIFLPTISDLSELPKRAFIQSGTLLLLALWCFQMGREERPRLTLPFLLLPFLALLAWGAASLAYAVNHFEGIRHLLHYGACALFFLICANSLTRDDLPTLLDILVLAGLGIALLGVSQYLFLFKAIPQAVPPAATFVNKNIAADFVLIALPLTIALFLKGREPKAVWAYALSSGLMVVFLLYTRTRAAWLAAGAEAMVLLLWAAQPKERAALREKWSRAKGYALLTTMAMVLLMANLGPDGFSWQLDDIGQRAASITDSKQHINRLAIWQNTLAMVKDYPILGVGLGNHKVFYPLYTHAAAKDALFSLEIQLVNVHNDFLQYLAELGLIAFPLLAWLCFVIDRNYFRPSAGNADLENSAVVTGAYAALLGIFVSSCFGFPFQMATPPFYLALLLAVMHVTKANPATQNGFTLPRRIPIYLGLLALVGVVALGGYHYRAILADGHSRDAKRFLAQRQWTQALYEGLQARHLAPDNKKILSEIGAASIEIGNLNGAIEALNTVLQAYPNLINAQLNLAVAHTRKGEYGRAEELYLQSLTILPERVDTYLRLAKLALIQKDQTRAIRYYEKALHFAKEEKIRIFILMLIDSVDEPLPSDDAATPSPAALSPSSAATIPDRR